MKVLISALMLPLAMACQPLPSVDENGVIIPPPPPPLPAQVRAAMPDGMPDSFIFKTADGCYAVGIEASEPRQGRPLRDANNQWVCDDGVVPPDLTAAVDEPAAEPA